MRESDSDLWSIEDWVDYLYEQNGNKPKKFLYLILTISQSEKLSTDEKTERIIAASKEFGF